MRIGLVIEYLDSWRGGAETSTGQFIDHLIASGIQVEVFTRSRPPSYPGCVIHTVKVPARLKSQAAAHFLRRAASAATKAELDLIHAMVPCASADIYEPRGGTVIESVERNVAVRKSATARAVKAALLRLNPKQQVLLRAEKKLLTRSSPPTVVAISQYVARQIKTHYGLNADRVRIIFNGVNPDDASPQDRTRHRREIRTAFGIRDDAYLMLMVAHNFKLKGLAQAIDAVASLEVPNGPAPVLVIVGRGQPNAYKKRADRLGAAERVRFVGGTDRVPTFYHAADVLVHPTFYDPCSRVVLEALAAGLPCITTRWNGAAEIIEDGVQGYVIDSPHDIGKLRQSMERLADADERARFSAAASKLRPRLTMQSHTEQIIDLYRALVKR